MPKLVCPFSVEISVSGADGKPLRERCIHLKKNTTFCDYDGVVKVFHSNIFEKINCSAEKQKRWEGAE